MHFPGARLRSGHGRVRMKRMLAAIVCASLAACGGGGGGGGSAAVDGGAAAGGTGAGAVSTAAAPIEVSLNASSASTVAGQPITLTWNAQNAPAGTCNASGAWSGQLATSGTQSVTPPAAGTSSYTITCNGVSKTSDVVVSAAPTSKAAAPVPAPAPAPAATTVNISASPSATVAGQPVTLTWNASNATAGTCNASGAWSGTLATSGTQTVTAPAPGTASYTLTCSGVANTASVAVSAAPPPVPTVNIAITPGNITSAQSAQLSWSSANADSCTASGAWSGPRATAGNLQLAQDSAGAYTYLLTCSGAAGSATGSAMLAVSAGVDNAASLILDTGPAGINAINVPYVNVTVCRPGTSICQTIDHVMVDTGSVGLRLLTPLNAALVLPAVATASGAPAGACAKFVSGFAWGPVQRADVRIAGETAPSLPIHVVSNTSGAFATIPRDCSSAGSNLGSVAALGANGILGISMFRQDCGSTCANGPISGAYYACTGARCISSAMALAQQVSNPVAAFSTDNNGVILVVPAVPAGGVTALTGTLIFGIGTQANNHIESETAYAADSSGNFKSAYQGRALPQSFLDSGSNGLFFDDAAIRPCTLSIGFYCPLATLNLSATNSSFDGARSSVVNFHIESVDGLGAAVIAASIGGTYSGAAAAPVNGSFDWGLPFFFGRRVFVAIEGATTPAGPGPYWAY